MTLAVNTHV